MVQDSLAHFHTSEHDVEDRSWSCRPSGLNDELLHLLSKHDPQQKSSRLAKALGAPQSTKVEHLITIGFVTKLSKWVLHQPTKAHQQPHVQAAVLLLSFKRIKTWLNSFVTEDERWALHANIQAG